MTTSSDITALKTRCSAVEVANKTQAAQIAALGARIVMLEAIRPFDPASLLAANAVTVTRLSAITDALATLGARVAALEAAPLPEPDPLPGPVQPPTRLHNYRVGSADSGRTFENVTFDGNDPVKAVLDLSQSVSHVTFKTCTVERSAGGGDCIGIVEDGTSASGAHISDITFDGCHVGAVNAAGLAGSPRGGIEVYTWDGGTGKALHGWSNVQLLGCLFEASDSFCVDVADYPLASGARASGPAVVRGCTLKGGGKNGGQFGYTLCIESPHDVLIENNTILRASENTIRVSLSSGLAQNYVIRGNVIDLSVGDGIAPNPSQYAPLMYLTGKGEFSGNAVTYNVGGHALQLDQFGGTVAGNTFSDLRTSGNPWALVYGNCNGASVTGNTFKTAASAAPVLWNAGNNVATTVGPNTLVTA